MPRPPPVTIATRPLRSTVMPTRRRSVAENAVPARARARRQVGPDLLGAPLPEPVQRDALRAVRRATRPARADDQRGEPLRLAAGARRSRSDVVSELLAVHFAQSVGPGRPASRARIYCSPILRRISQSSVGGGPRVATRRRGPAGAGQVRCGT